MYIALKDLDGWWRLNSHDDVIEWKPFPRYWPFVREIHRSPVNSPHKGQWRGALMFSSICFWINGWVNNREAGDLRRYRVHYDVIVMLRYYRSAPVQRQASAWTNAHSPPIEPLRTNVSEIQNHMWNILGWKYIKNFACETLGCMCWCTCMSRVTLDITLVHGGDLVPLPLLGAHSWYPYNDMQSCMGVSRGQRTTPSITYGW